MLSIIAAVSNQGALGKDNRLLWHLPADLKHFKTLTLKKPIIMGRKTYESIGRPLPKRINIIITRDENYQAEGCVITHSLKEAIKAAGDAVEIMVIGGAEIYRQAIPLADRIYLTHIDANIDGDAYFPKVPSEFHESSREEHIADARNTFNYCFLTLDK